MSQTPKFLILTNAASGQRVRINVQHIVSYGHPLPTDTSSAMAWIDVVNADNEDQAKGSYRVRETPEAIDRALDVIAGGMANGRAMVSVSDYDTPVSRVEG